MAVTPQNWQGGVSVEQRLSHTKFLLHDDHTRNSLQASFYGNALIVGTLKQLIQRCSNFIHVIDGLVAGGLGREGVPIEREHGIGIVANGRCGERMFLAVVHLG